MKAFVQSGKLYIRIIPSKFMMNSTMIYDIVTRGDILAVNVSDQKIYLFKGTDQVTHVEGEFSILQPVARQGELEID